MDSKVATEERSRPPGNDTENTRILGAENHSERVFRGTPTRLLIAFTDTRGSFVPVPLIKLRELPVREPEGNMHKHEDRRNWRLSVRDSIRTSARSE